MVSEERRALGVSQYWDKLSGETALASEDDIGRELGETIRALYTMTQAPLPAASPADAAVDTLLAQAGKTNEQPATRSASPPILPEYRVIQNGRYPQAVPSRSPISTLRGYRKWIALPLAAAVLLLIAGAGVYLFDDRRNEQPRVIPAAVQDDFPGKPFYTESPRLIWETNRGSEPLLGPGKITIDLNGDIWVADNGNCRFAIFSPDGTFVETWGACGLGLGQFSLYSRSFGAAVFDAAGNLYVIDSGNFRVQKFDASRKFVTLWGSHGDGEGQFQIPNDIAVDESGRVFVVDQRRNDVQVFDSTGRFLFKFGKLGNGEGEFSTPEGLTIGPDGHIWVADTGNDRVQEFDANGTFLAAYGGYGTEPGQMKGPHDVAVDLEGRIFVSEEGGNRIQVLGPDGQPLTIWGDSGEGELRRPRGIAVDNNGGVYTSDIGLSRVQKFQLGSFPDTS